MTIKWIRHVDPVWRDKMNFIIRARDEAKDENGQEVIEQLSSRQIKDQTFEICCIPFFAYNLSLGDEVISDSGYIISEVIKPSGHYTFRVWFGNSPDPDIREIVVRDVSSLGCHIEWFSNNLLAIDAESFSTAQSLADYLQEKENMMKLKFETGRL